MKKTKLFSALALASCVMLSGCGKNKPEEPTVDPKLTVADLPHLVAGEQFDVSNYVTAQGGTGAVTITLDASCTDFASVDSTATKITALHSGEVKFTVHYGNLKVDCTAAVDSKEYLAYVEATKDPIYDFYGEEYDTSTGKLDSGFYFSKDVYLSYHEGEWSGYVQYGDQVYGYTVIPGATEDDDDSLKFEITGYEPESIEEYCYPFGLTADKGVQKYVSQEEDLLNKVPTGYECISFTSEQALKDAAFQGLGLSVEMLDYYGVTMKEAQVLPETIETEEGTYTLYYVALFVSGPSEADPTKMVDDVIGGYVEFAKDPNIGIVESLLPEEAPTGADASAMFASAKPKIDAHDFVVNYSFGWYEVGESAVTPLESNPFYDATDPNLGKMVNHYLNATGSITGYVSPNQTFILNRVGDTQLIEGFVNHDGDVYSYSGSDPAALEAVLIEEDTTIFANDEISGNSKTYTFLNDLSKVFYNSFDDTDATATTSYKAAEDVMYDLFVRPIPEVIPFTEVETYAELVALSFDFGNMMAILSEELFMAVQDVSISYAYDEDMEDYILSVSIAIPDSYTDADQNKHNVVYMIQASVTMWGLAEMYAEVALPALTINYPAEA